MTLNTMDWLQHTAVWMQQDRPDIYSTAQEAFTDLHNHYDSMSEEEGSGWTAWGGFMLHKHEEDGVVEWNLMKKITSLDIFIEEFEVSVTNWTKSSGTMSRGVEYLPAPGEHEGP